MTDSRRGWLRSWWLVFALCPFWTRWTSFVYTGLRAKRPLWIAWGAVYGAIVTELARAHPQWPRRAASGGPRVQLALRPGSLLAFEPGLVDDLRDRVVCPPF